MTKPKPMESLTPLEKWLRRNNKSKGELAEAVGCHRHTIGKACDEVPVSEEIALKILFITGGLVKLEVAPVGRS